MSSELKSFAHRNRSENRALFFTPIYRSCVLFSICSIRNLKKSAMLHFFSLWNMRWNFTNQRKSCLSINITEKWKMFLLIFIFSNFFGGGHIALKWSACACNIGFLTYSRVWLLKKHSSEKVPSSEMSWKKGFGKSIFKPTPFNLLYG